MKKNIELLRIIIEEYINYVNYKNIYHKVNVTESLLFGNSFVFCTPHEVLKNYIGAIEHHFYLNQKESLIFFEALSIIDDNLSRRGCNDFVFPDTWNFEERKQYNKELNILNGSPEYHIEDLEQNCDFVCSQDFSVCFYLKHKFKQFFENGQILDKISRF
jgi:hypothetical protein